jgi:molybdopterin-guanine dinucleotide biosynthesis protein A
MARSPLAAAILAGGAARRLGGRQKPLLVVHGLTIIERQLAVLREVAEPVFVVAADADTYARFGVEVVPDRIPNCGALGGIYTAIVTAPRERVLVVACDMPFLNAPLLRAISEKTADLVIPRSARGLEPLCAIYTKACAQPIRDRLSRRALEASVLPEGILVEEIGPEVLAAYDPDGLLFVNVNTPHDYERALELAGVPAKALRDRIMDDP